jgi:hypothetical protein
MSSLVTGWTWLHVSLGALRAALDLPLPRVREQRLLKLLTDAMERGWSGERERERDE